MSDIATTIGLNIANELIGKVLMQIRETGSATHNVLFAKRSFRELQSHITKIEPILVALWHRNVQGSSDTVKIALEELQEQLNKASRLINSYTSGSWMYLFLKLKLLPDEMKEITGGIERSLHALRIATLDVSLEIKEKTVALCETMRNAEFKAEVGTESLVGEIEREMQHMQSDSRQVLQLIVQVANAMGVDMDHSSLHSEVEKVRQKKEALENNKKEAEAYMLNQIQAFLCRSGIVSTDSSLPVSQPVPLYFFCPLSEAIMEDPVDLETGITYERSAIEKWFESGNTTCPVNKCEVQSRHLIPNRNLRELIREWKQSNAKFRIDTAATKLATEAEAEAALVDLSTLCAESSSYSRLIGDKGLIPAIFHLTSSNLDSVRLKAMQCLCCLAEHDTNKEKIAKAGEIEEIVNYLTEETEMKSLAVSLLLELSKDHQLRNMIGETRNSIPLLVSMLSGPHAEKSREVLTNLSRVDANIIEMAEVHYYDPLVNQLIQGSLKTKMFLADKLSKIKHIDCSRASVTNGGIIPSLLQMISEDNPESMLVSLSALKNLSRMAENCVCILDANVASRLFTLMFMASIRIDLREQAAEILANLARASSKGKKIHQKLKTLASEENIKSILDNCLMGQSLKVHLLQILLGLSSKSSRIMLRVRSAQGIHVLLTLICDLNPDVRIYVTKLLICLTEDGGEEELAENLGETHIKTLVDRISNANREEEKAVSAGILCRLPKDNDKIRTVLLHAGGLDATVRLLSSAESSNCKIREGGTLIENGLGVLLHFTSPSDLIIQKRAIELGIMPLLVGFLLTGSSLAKHRAATALGQISESTIKTSTVIKPQSSVLYYACGWWASPDPEQICHVHGRICATEASFCLVNAGAVEPLVRALQDRECRADEAALDALITLLGDGMWEAGLKEIEKANGIGPIVQVLRNGSPDAQEKAMLVLEKIFQKHEYRSLYATAARFPLIDLMQKGPSSTGRRATTILQLLGEMPEDSGWMQSQ
ncbi:hypothetical protein SUGI_0926970 [Cryptomeria japonica]|uniref:U-box domain-containing protein 24 n=1 Tax=Cryptomeria japonica TaxID=3369 RepID=UPI002414A7C1|nr:U-box domain-containing protein 24 [Cryptomeria japonica]GLJ44292.1 hypothetical protein SUGI_0926970 [Cryptomeria japonica]